MKILIIKILGIAVIGVIVVADAAEAAPICLSTHDMLETQPQKDGASIVFKMRDDSVWRNDLHGRCPELWFDSGFVWTVKNGDGSVCENQESLRVLKSAEVCTLGRFTLLTPPRAEQHAAR